MRKLGVIALSLMFALPVFAQQTSSDGTRETVRQEVQQMRASAQEAAQAMRSAIRAEIEQRRGEFRDMLEEQRKKTKQKIEEKRTMLKEKLQTIKEENKKRIIENIDKRMDALNEQRTEQFASALDQMEAVLGKIAERADRAEAQGRDVAAARTAIIGAKDAIASARSAVVAQAGKTYVITITTDAKLKDDVIRAREAMKKDITTAFTAVKDARDAVHDAAVALAQTAQGEKEKTATSTDVNQ